MFNILFSSISATIDIIALIFILFFAIYGAIKGFTKTFFSLFGTFIGLLLAVLLSPAVAKFMQSEHGVVNSLSNELSGVVSNLFGENIMSIKISEVSSGSSKLTGLSGYVVSTILSMQTNAFPPETTVGEVLCPVFAYYIVLILSVVVLFIIFKLIFAVVCAIIKDAHKFISVARFDKTLGFFSGIIHGIISLELLIMIISIIPLPFIQNIYLNIQHTVITKFLEDINLFELIIRGISQSNVIETIKSLI